ncbi:MAG: DnaJ domain-containing protein [Thermoanaerobaculia bacterium]|nr:DnaJ domain-containing protein [Thermoanaerobaculia bacterium]
MESFLNKDFYAILDVPRDADDKEIKRRFRELARERHPDRFQGEEKAKAEQDFQDITEAFNVLTDPVRRRQVDLNLQQPQKVEHDPSGIVRVYMNRGIRAFKQSNLIEAASNFSRAADTDPQNAQAWHHLALACSKEKRWTQKAQEAILKACELRPDHAPYFKLAGQIFRDAGMASRAKQYYNQAIKLGSTDASVRKALRELSGGDATDGSKSPAKEKSGLFGKLF